MKKEEKQLLVYGEKIKLEGSGKNFLTNFLNDGNWFDKKYTPKSGGRYITFKTALNLFLQRGLKNVVETGTTRFPDDWGAGMSTLLFADFIKKEVPGGKLWTVDLNSNNLNACREITKDFPDIIEYVHADSIEYLKHFKKPTDFLYLDSMDYPLTKEEGMPEDCQIHQMNEYYAAKNKLTEKAIVLLDDNQVVLNGELVVGKTRITKEVMLEDKWELLIDYQQTLFQK